MSQFTIALNASQDLYEAGFENDEIQIAAFESAYRKAASELAEERGLEIDVICGSDAETAGRCDNTGEDNEADRLWQEIHDRVSWTHENEEAAAAEAAE